MVGLPYDLLANPPGAVRATFDKAISGGCDTVLLDGKDWGIVDLFRQFLGGISQVPVLITSTFKCLQRFRDMVQDMLGNELYVGAYKDGSVWRTNKYIDLLKFRMDNSSDMKLWDRSLFYCVPWEEGNHYNDYQSHGVSTDAAGSRNMILSMPGAGLH